MRFLGEKREPAFLRPSWVGLGQDQAHLTAPQHHMEHQPHPMQPHPMRPLNQRTPLNPQSVRFIVSLVILVTLLFQSTSVKLERSVMKMETSSINTAGNV